MRRLTIRTKDGKVALNCYDCKAQQDATCAYQMCRRRLVERLAIYEDWVESLTSTMKEEGHGKTTSEQR